MDKKIDIFCYSVVILIILIGMTGCVEKGDNILLNSGFEAGSDAQVDHWGEAIVAHENLTMLWDDTVFYNGSRSVGIKNTQIYENETANNWFQQTRKIPFGKTIELTGWVKTKNAGEVVMVVQCFDKNINITAFGTTEISGPITGTTDWTYYTATPVEVPWDTRLLVVRLVLNGTGEAWFDDVTLVVK